MPMFELQDIKIDVDEDGFMQEPDQWTEKVALWQQEGKPASPVGARFYVTEFPLAHLWLASPDEPLFLSDIFADERVDDQVKSRSAQSNSRASLNLPLTHGGRWVGLFVSHRRGVDDGRDVRAHS